MPARGNHAAQEVSVNANRRAVATIEVRSPARIVSFGQDEELPACGMGLNLDRARRSLITTAVPGGAGGHAGARSARAVVATSIVSMSRSG